MSPALLASHWECRAHYFKILITTQVNRGHGPVRSMPSTTSESHKPCVLEPKAKVSTTSHILLEAGITLVFYQTGKRLGTREGLEWGRGVSPEGPQTSSL